jgi:hypothetical protein
VVLFVVAGALDFRWGVRTGFLTEEIRPMLTSERELAQQRNRADDAY